MGDEGEEDKRHFILRRSYLKKSFKVWPSSFELHEGSYSIWKFIHIFFITTKELSLFEECWRKGFDVTSVLRPRERD
jgi:hypothetical protein